MSKRCSPSVAHAMARAREFRAGTGPLRSRLSRGSCRNPGGNRGWKPAAIVFDVNETLSDISPLADRFADVGAPPLLAKVWFASLLRDGFALGAAGDKQAFAYIGAEARRGLLPAKELNRDAEEAVKHIMTGLPGLKLHPDVPGGVRALKNAGYRLATLTNGSTGTAEKLFTDGGIRDQFDLLLSVEDAPAWKPAPASYHYASSVLGVPPGQLLLVAAHPWDIHEAARAGLHTAWLNRTGAQYPAYFSKPDYTVATLEELPGALAAYKCPRVTADRTP